MDKGEEEGGEVHDGTKAQLSFNKERKKMPSEHQNQ